jgi:multiple sugar transport system substrate-binding protein
MTFIRFWSGLERPERAAAFNTSGGWLPLRRATVRSPDYQDFIARNPQFSTFVDQLDSIHLEPLAPVAYQVFFQNRVSACEDHAVRGSKTPAQALADLEAEIERERARRARLMPRRAQAAP